MTKSYYAMSWIYGEGMHTESGRRAAAYCQFSSRAERDEWVANGPPYRSAGGYRDAVSASDPDVRRTSARDRWSDAAYL